MKCKHCGAEIANDSVYCEFCGKFTNPANKKGVTCEANLVKWLLYSVMFILCASNVIAFFYCDMSAMAEKSYSIEFLFFFWWIVPFLSLIIFIVSLILTLKKKISIIFTLVMFLLFGANVTVVAVGLANSWTESYRSIEVRIQPLHSSNEDSQYMDPQSIHLQCNASRWGVGRYTSDDEANLAIDRMGLPHQLSTRDFELSIYPSGEMTDWQSYATELTIVIVTIIEGAILLIYLISYAIYAPIAARKRRQLQ